MMRRIVLFGMGILSCLNVLSLADNSVQFDLGRYGQVGTVDTLFVGGHYEFRFSLANDILLGGLLINVRIWSDDGVNRTWLTQPDGFGYSDYVTVVPESRLDPARGTGSFDMTGLLVTEYEMNGIGTDLICFGGIAHYNGLPVGPLEHMFSLHFRPTAPTDAGVIGTICIDSTLRIIPDPWSVFVDVLGVTHQPQFNGPRCWPVKLLCGNPNGDNDVNVGDAVFMINYIFRDGQAPDPWWLGDANCDGTLDVGDVVFLIAASFRYGPQPQCCE